MKLGDAISWIMGRLQQNLFPSLEECWEAPLTEKEQQLVAILELVQVENFIPKNSAGVGRKLLERVAIARAFVAKAVYNHPFTRTTVEALNSSPNLRRICGFEKGVRCSLGGYFFLRICRICRGWTWRKDS